MLIGQNGANIYLLTNLNTEYAAKKIAAKKTSSF